MLTCPRSTRATHSSTRSGACSPRPDCQSSATAAAVPIPAGSPDPNLTLVVAHCGLPEYAEFIELASRARLGLGVAPGGVVRERRAAPREISGSTVRKAPT